MCSRVGCVCRCGIEHERDRHIGQLDREGKGNFSSIIENPFDAVRSSKILESVEMEY